MADLQVEVWDYAAQKFIPHFSCPGEQRVRVDHHGSLSDLAVFEVDRDTLNPEVFFVVSPHQPLNDWKIDYS